MVRNNSTAHLNEAESVSSERAWALCVYILYLVGFAFWPITIVGLVIAYVGDHRLARLNPSDPRFPMRSHFGFQVRTFWLQLLFGLISISLYFVNEVLSAIAILIVAVWFIVRCAKGLVYLMRNRSHPHPETLLFG